MLINFKKPNGQRTSIKLSNFDLDMFCYYIGFYAGNDFDENNEQHVAYVKKRILKIIEHYDMDFDINSLRAYITGGIGQMIKMHHQQFDDHQEDFKLEMEQDGVIK